MNTGNVLQKFWALSLVVLLAGFIGIGQTYAQNTYYVDVATGNDAFDGSQMSVGLFPAGPFATINQAMTTAASGDTIVILAGNYTAQPVIDPANESFTLQVRTSGGNLNVNVAGFNADDAGRTLTLGVEAAGSGGAFVTDGAGTDLALTAGTVNVTGALTIGGGALVTRQNGSLTGNVPTFTNYSLTYGAPAAGLTANTTAGNELAASLGTGTLTFQHTGALVTVPNAVSASTVTSTTAGNVTFNSNVTASAAAAGAFNVSGGATVTVSGSLTASNAVGGITVSGTSALSAGATTVTGAPFAHSGTGAVALASLSLPNNTSVLNVTNTGNVTVSGAISAGGTLGRTIINNTSTATVTAGTVSTSVAAAFDTAGDDADFFSTINNGSTGAVVISGAITEGSILETVGVAAPGQTEYHGVGLTNAAGGYISVGASSTLRGDINNAEADGAVAGVGVVDDGIRLANSSTLTVLNLAGANITQFGDFIGGTLVLSYANAWVDAATAALPQLTLANNVTFDAIVMNNPAGGNLGAAGVLKFGGNVVVNSFSAAGPPQVANTLPVTFNISGNLVVNVNGTAVNPGAATTLGGLNIAATGVTFGGLGTVTVTGTTATLSNTTFANNFSATSADATITAPGGFGGSLAAKSIVFSGAAVSAVATTINVTDLTVSSGTTVNWGAPGATSDISGTATVNGIFNVGAAAGIGIGSMTIDPTTGTVATAGATTWNFDGSGFTGGTYTDTGSDDTVNFAVPSNGTTVSVKPGTIWGNLGFTGSGRTATVTESVTVAGNVNLGNDVTVVLGENSIVMTGAGGTLTLQDEASITNSGTNGSVQFNANAQVITVTGAPNVTPTLTNVVVNNATVGPTALLIDEPINIAGTLALLDGGVNINGATGTNATPIAVTFTGASAAISRTFPNEGITLAVGNTIAGTYDLTGSGTTGTFGAEYAANQIRNLTISATGAVTEPGVTATISGNVNISNATGSFTTVNSATVAGNVTVTGTLGIAGATTFGFSGVLTTANNATGGIVNGAGTLRFNGANQSHSHAGDIQAPARFSAAGIVVTGSIAAGDLNGDSEFGNITVDANADATLNTIQDINGTVTVSGTLTANLVNDGGPALGPVDADGQITGLVDVNNGGSFTLSSNDTATTLTGGATVNDGGTFTLGSNLGSAAAMVVGDGTQATAATFDLNGNTFTTGANTFTVVANTGGGAPGFGTAGTLLISNGGSIVGTTNPTVPNVTVVGDGFAIGAIGDVVEISSDVTVTGTFTLSTNLVTGANGRDVTLSGANAVGQFNASYSANIGAAGSQIVTTGTTIQTNTAVAIAIPNLWVNSTSTTTMTENIVAAGTATYNVNWLNHDAGVLDITNSTFNMVGDANAATIDWDYDGGSYAGTGAYVVGVNTSGIEVDVDLNNASVSIPNLTVVDTAPGGMQLGTLDNLTVTGTLTLNNGAGNVQTENGATTDATFSVANGATIVRSTAGATNHFDNAPTLGTGLTVRYTAAAVGAQVTTSAELPSALARLEWENATAGADLFFADNRAITTDYLELAGNLSVDENDDGDNSLTITAGGTVEFDGALADFIDQGPAANPDETYTAAGAITLLFSGPNFTTSDLHWPNAVTGSMVTVNVTGGNGGVTLHENKSAGAVTVGDGITPTNGTATLATGAFTLTAESLTVAFDGIVTGAVNVSGALTSAGTTAGVAITAQGDVTLSGAAPGALTLNGTSAQSLVIPAGGFVLAAPLTINNAAGVNQTGGPLTTALAGPGLVLTNGVFNVANLTIGHGGPGAQGFAQTNGCVYGNVTKAVVGVGGGPGTAAADRLQYPLCTQSGTMRTAAITFNDPGAILSAPANITIRHDQAGENGVADLAGTNQLPVMVNGVNIARYPTGPSFFWTITPNFTMSPSLQYDVELRGNNYPNFSSSCDTAACDINEIFAIRRAVGSNSNPWVVASNTIDNFLSGANSPVVIARTGTGSLQTSGTIWTYGLKSIFAAAGNAPAVTVTTGNTHDVDLTTLFTGFTGALNYTVVASDASGVTSPALTDINAGVLTLTGGADAGTATVTVTAQDSFGGTATATFEVTNGAALVASGDDLDRAMNVGGTSEVVFGDVFSGGAGTVTYAATSDDASVTVSDDGTTVTMTGAAVGTANVTLTATDGSTTPVVVTKTIAVTVNAAMTVANAVADMDVEQGATMDVDVSSVFADGTGTITVSVSGGNDTVGATIDGNTVTVSGLKAYEGSPLADTAPVTITLTGTDTVGGTTTDAFDVNVTPVLGDLDGSGAPSAASASLALDASLGLVTLTAKQQTAVDYNMDSAVTAYDAALIFAAAANAKGEVVANPATDLVFGELSYEGDIISIPVQVVGDINDVVSASFATRIDPALATIAGVTSDLADGWMVRSVVAEDGTINLAVAGIGDIDADGTIATINVQLTGNNVQFNLDAEGAVNNNPTMALDAVEVAELPESFTLHGNYPNPFNPTTSINFDLPESADVEIQVIDMIGRQVMTLPATTIAAGANRTVQINASQLASGTYFYRVIAKMESKTLVETGRMMLVK